MHVHYCVSQNVCNLNVFWIDFLDSAKSPSSPKKSERPVKEDTKKTSKSFEKLKTNEESQAPTSETQDNSGTTVVTDTNALVKEKHRAACTVIVQNFTPDLFETDVKSVLIAQKNQRQVHYPVPDRESNVAAILMKSNRDAQKAVKRLDKMKIKGLSHDSDHNYILYVF